MVDRRLRPLLWDTGRLAERDSSIVGFRQKEGERAPAPWSARNAEFAAEEARDIAADRQAETRSAVSSTGRTVGLLKGFEDELLLFGRNADSGVGDVERHVALRDARGFAVGGRAILQHPNSQRDGPTIGEFEGIRKQVFQN